MLSKTEPRLSFRFIPLALTVLIVLVFVLIAFSRPALAATTNPLFVNGKVMDSANHPVDGAHVVILIVETNAQRTYDTGPDGSFASYPDFDPNTDYLVGNTLRVTATSALGTKSNETTITQQMNDDMEAIIWVDYDTAIPEFGSFVGFVVSAFAVGAVTLVMLGRRRK